MAEKTWDLPDRDNSDNVTAIVQYYRGEMNRMNTWRRRLDVTTNWAIVVTAAFISFGFGDQQMTHFVFILATVFVLFLLIIESRRYKYYDLFRWRIALMNENYFATIFSPEVEPLHKDWRKLMTKELQHAQFKISFLEAFGRRLRRNYSWIFTVLGFCWLTKVSIHPTPMRHISEIFERADLFHLVPGWVVVLIGVLFNGALIVIGFATMKRRKEEIRIYPARKGKFNMPNY